MTALYIAAGIAIVVVALWLLIRRRRSEPRAIRRDVPTFEQTVSARPRLGTRLGGLFRREIDAAFWPALEEALIAADAGVATAVSVVERSRGRDPATRDEARQAVRSELLAAFGTGERSLSDAGDPTVIVIVGVNGSGKTTTIAKLADRFIAEGRSVLVGAADTFRAAATEQVVAWGERLGFDVVRGGEGADPASVAFDARSAAVARGRDVVMIDTAGRLHSKRNLMDELAKVVRIVSRDGPLDEVLLVLDGSTGSNGLAQARAFTEAVGVTGAVITKLDGTAKGGVAIAVERDLGIPIKLIGVGERPEDLLHFDPAAFVDELLGAE